MKKRDILRNKSKFEIYFKFTNSFNLDVIISYNYIDIN